MSSQSSQMQSVSIVPRQCVHIGAVFTEQNHEISMSFITGVMQRGPLVQTVPVHLNRVPVIPVLQQKTGLVIHALLAKDLQLLVVAIDIGPKISPAAFGVCRDV